MIPTAEEFVKPFIKDCTDTQLDLMREFAKLHVEAALEKATHVLDVNNDADYIEHPTPKRILNSYPLTNIK